MEKIKELREKTGAGMVDCQKALKETGGDIAVAVELLRKKGIAKAAKRGDRETSEGLIRQAVGADKKSAYMLELSAETDFVARNEKFIGFAGAALEILKTMDSDDLDVFLALPMDKSTVGETLAALSGTIGEKMEFNDLSTCSGTCQWAWDYDYDGFIFDIDYNQENYASTTYAAFGTYVVRMELTDTSLGAGATCSTSTEVIVGPHLPDWKEVEP